MIKTIDDVKVMPFNTYTEEYIGNDWGTLVPLDFIDDVPFEINRMFYVYNVGDRHKRGEHSHYTTEQVLICVKGSCGVFCKDGQDTKYTLLDSPSIGLYVPNMIWDEQIYMSKDTVLLVLCSTQYTRSDYIEDWQDYLKAQSLA